MGRSACYRHQQQTVKSCSEAVYVEDAREIISAIRGPTNALVPTLCAEGSSSAPKTNNSSVYVRIISLREITKPTNFMYLSTLSVFLAIPFRINNLSSELCIILPTLIQSAHYFFFYTPIYFLSTLTF